MNSKLYEKYKDIILYVIFGVLTTVVNIVVYWGCAHPLRMQVIPSTVVAWILAVLFAYFTNRKWVFHSEVTSHAQIIKEIVSFFSCRLFTGIVDWVCMYVFADLMHWNDVGVKTGANILVIILNYAASKFLIFRKNDY